MKIENYTRPTFDFEQKLWEKGYRYIVGLDEVGRGAWAGPVVVGAVIFSPQSNLPKEIRDSKELSPTLRGKLSKIIKRRALAFSFGLVKAREINKIGIGKATQLAMRKAIRNLSLQADFHLIDAFYIKYLKRSTQLPIKKGDKKSLTIASASIIAKVFRDELMVELATFHPGFYFDQNKGYGTKRHQEAIRSLGFCPIHRTSFNLNYLITHES